MDLPHYILELFTLIHKQEIWLENRHLLFEGADAYYNYAHARHTFDLAVAKHLEDVSQSIRAEVLSDWKDINHALEKLDLLAMPIPAVQT